MYNYTPYDFTDDLYKLNKTGYLTVILKNPPNNHYHVSNGIITVSIWAKSKRCKWSNHESFEYDNIYEVIDYINQNSPDIDKINTAKEEHATALNAILDRINKNIWQIPNNVSYL